jgi:phenylpropionate dioxygenase-like ring-hydroxylating dioxygenase large terminal subunit
MFVKNAWYVGAWSAEVAAGETLARKILGIPTVLFRSEAGVVHALEDRCCHRGLPLSLGSVAGDHIKCGYHGLEFSGTGRCVLIPGQDKIPSVMKVKSFPVVEKDALVWIWCGDPARADEKLIPDFPYHTDPHWPNIPHVQHVKCAFNLVIDNLLDQTHLAYVHKSTIGGNAAAHADAGMEIDQTERGVHFVRWLEDAPPPPSYIQAGIGFIADEPIDRWAEFEYVAPCSVLQFTGGLPRAAEARKTGRRDGGWALRIMHNITPETDTTCHYFWSACHGFKRDDASVTTWFRDQIRDTFLEDETVLEAQQARLLEMPGRLLSTRHDEARILAERALLRMVAADKTLTDVDAAAVQPAST